MFTPPSKQFLIFIFFFLIVFESQVKDAQYVSQYTSHKLSAIFNIFIFKITSINVLYKIFNTEK